MFVLFCFVFKRKKSGYTDIIRIILLNKIMYVSSSYHKYCLIFDEGYCFTWIFHVLQVLLVFHGLSNKIITNSIAWLNGLQIVMLTFWITEKSTSCFVFGDFHAEKSLMKLLSQSLLKLLSFLLWQVVVESLFQIEVHGLF